MRRDSEAIGYLRKHAVNLRSIDPSDTDWSDLEPFAHALKRVRVIGLGEISHGDGSSFLAKTRLVKWLHQTQGFDVLAFESGFYDCHVAWASTGTVPALDSFREGVFGVWSRSAETVELARYLTAQARSTCPLELVGVDCQLTGLASETRLGSDLEALRDQLALSVSAHDWAVYVAALERLAKHEWYEQKPTLEEWQCVDRVHGALRAALEHTDLADHAFWRQCLKSLDEEMTNQWLEDQAQPEWVFGNRRDAQMAQNLLWQLEQRPTRRFIVWAATFHLARGLERLKSDLDRQRFASVRTMGDHLHVALGDAYYALGVSGDHGEMARYRDAKPFKLVSTQPGDLEWWLNEAGLETALLNWRSLPPTHPLTKALAAKQLGTHRLTGLWSQIQDGLLFTRQVTRSHRAAL
jgi:erythromycin esterase